jgi:peptide/nickel transport system substrate-binding protein
VDINHGRLGRLREGQGEIANHVIDEYAAGRLSRRDFLRRGAVVGISLPVLGAVISACGSSGSSTPSTSSSSGAGAAGATIKAGIVVPTATINPVTVADQGGLDMLGQTGEYLTFSTQHRRCKWRSPRAGHPTRPRTCGTFKIRGGVSSTTASRYRRRRRLRLQTANRPEGPSERVVGVSAAA